LFGRWLHTLLALGEIRYRAFLILPSLALAWLIAGVIVPAINRRAQILGVLGLIVLYDWLTTAAGTFGEFERLRMAINPISTAIVLGTLLLLVRLALSSRDKLIPALALVALDLAVMGGLHQVTSTALSELILVALALIQAAALVRWSEPLTALIYRQRPPAHEA
jgi:hypothetical protein